MKSIFFLLMLTNMFVFSTAHSQSASDYVSLAVGGYDFDKDQERRKSVDYRIEYEWGFSLLPSIGNYFYNIQLHPMLGIEGNTKGAFLGESGLNFDALFLHHVLFTWGEAVGAFDPGNDPRPLGSILQFRSQVELGWQFDNHVRMTGYISHISNARVLNDDPGAEIIGAYLHIPLTELSWQ